MTPKILALDTSSFAGSVALCQGEALVAESLLNVRSTHSDNLLRQIDLLLAEARWSAWAQEAGVELGAFERCMRSEATAERVAADISEARKFGAKGTPTVFVNERLYHRTGRWGVEDFEAVRQRLKRR